ncbi:hypothetical protein F385_1451 [Pantoea agglomerans 299R]|nr:TIR domain-containing protein [Pantoea agglomerans]ELP25435.1 hypothetical protein F385_1451 [Pantoea agglomerans 299R]
MTLKLFISYSHKDEEYKEQLVEQLTPLERKGLLSMWQDRKILPGQEWNEEIIEKLDESDIILLLISSSFIASTYCIEKEISKAIEMHVEKRAIVVPIIVRECMWQKEVFARIQSLPKDGKAITSWDNADIAWTNVIKDIARLIEEVPMLPKNPSSKEVISDETVNWIEDTEIVLTHRLVPYIKNSDIYTPCDLKIIANNKTRDNEVEIIKSDITFKEKGLYLIFGEEQQGKTTLLKNIFSKSAASEKYAIYINAKELKSASIQKVLNECKLKQYKNINSDKFDKATDKVLLIDGFDDVSLNSKYRSQFLEEAQKEFEHIVITCNISFLYVCPEIQELNMFNKYELLGLGHERRAELVEKWICLGQEESINDSVLYESLDEISVKLDGIIRKNIVPPKPVYILMLLQMFETYSQQSLEMTSHGHCYQQLVYQAFDNAKIPKLEFEKYLNVLTELAWHMHLNDSSILESQLHVFFDNYQKVYLSVNGDEIISRLKSNSILHSDKLKIKFKYPYLFYFFTAKKIAEDYLQNKEVKDNVKEILSELHREDYANILVFVTHHTKDSWVLEEIKETLNALFKEHDPASLSNEQLQFMGDFIAQIPDLIIEQRSIKDERQKRKQELDRIEMENSNSELKDDDLEPPDILAKINKSFKGMDISGQIIRNRYATLKRSELFELASSGTKTGLRFLEYFLDLSDTLKNEIVHLIGNSLKEHPNLTDEILQRQAQTVFMQMSYGVINGVIRKMATSIGSKEAYEIYLALEDNLKTPAASLLSQAIDLQYRKQVDIKRLNETVARLNHNPVCQRILKEMVIQHTYMFPIGYKEKQQISELLKLSVKQQMIMDSKKTGKG